METQDNLSQGQAKPRQRWGILRWFFGALLTLFVTLAYLLGTPKGRSLFLEQLSRQISSELGSKLHIRDIGIGWKKVTLEGIWLEDCEKDTLAYLRRVEIKWTSLSPKGRHQRIRTILGDSLLIKIHPLSRKAAFDSLTNWSTFFQHLPRSTSKSKKPQDWIFRTIQLKNIDWQISGFDSLKRLLPNSRFYSRNLTVRNVKLQGDAWSAIGSVAIIADQSPDPYRISVGMSGRSEEIQFKNLIIHHPESHLSVKSLRINLPPYGQQPKEPFWSIHGLKLEIGDNHLGNWLATAAPWPEAKLICSKIASDSRGLSWEGGELKLASSLLLSTDGLINNLKSIGKYTQMDLYISAKPEWDLTVNALLENAKANRWYSSVVPELNDLKAYLPDSNQWVLRADLGFKNDQLQLHGVLNTLKTKLEFNAAHAMNKADWTGDLRVNHYQIALEESAFVTLGPAMATWQVSSLNKMSIQIRLDSSNYKDITLRNLAAELNWDHGDLQSQISLQDPQYTMFCTGLTHIDNNQIIDFQLFGSVDLRLPFNPFVSRADVPEDSLICDQIRLCGNLQANYQKVVEIADSNSLILGQSPWINLGLSEGSISCPVQEIPIQNASFKVFGSGNLTVCELNLNQDSLHTIGLYQQKQIQTAISQIGNFVFGNSQTSNDEVKFSTYLQILEAKKYLSFWGASPSQDLSNLKASLNWSNPILPALSVSLDSLRWGNYQTSGLRIWSDMFGSSQVFRGELNKINLNGSPFIDFLAYRQSRIGQNSTITINGSNIKNSDFLGIKAQLYAKDSNWSLILDSLRIQRFGQEWIGAKGGSVVKNGNLWSIQALKLKQGRSSLAINGLLSENPSDKVSLDLQDVEISKVLNLFGQNLAWLSGQINGKVEGNGLLEQPNLSGTLEVSDLTLDSIGLGQLNVQSQFIPGSSRLVINANLVQKDAELAVIKGWIRTDDKELPCDLETQITGLPLQLMELYLLPNLDSIRGSANAKIKISANLTEPRLKGYLALNQAKLRIPFLKCSYFVEDTIWVDSRSFQLKPSKIRDTDQGRAILSGKISHRFFKDWKYEFKLDSASNLLVLNEPNPNTGDYYYGLGRINGSGTIQGNEVSTDIKINAIAQRGSRLFVPLDQFSETTRYDFIRFMEPKAQMKPSAKPTQGYGESSGLDLRLSLNFNPLTEVSLILDRQAGDKIKGAGNGDLVFTMTKEGDIRLDGGYTFTKGEYSFNLGNIASKNFAINNGSKIDWNGDPLQGQMQIDATYEKPASVRNLLSAAQAQQDSRNTLRTQTILSLSGPVLKPEVKFKINLPTLNMGDPNDPLVQQITRINNNEQELNNQVLGLLVSNQFIPSENLNASTIGLSTGASAFNSVTEMLTNRLSSLISNSLGSGINLGINYRGDLGTGLMNNAPNNNGSLADSNRRDLNLALNASLFNNRLLVDGKLAMGNSLQVNAQNMAGEIQLEYLITPNGTLRARAFNRLDDRILFNQNLNYRQGIGFSYNRNLDRLNQMFRRTRN